MNKVMTKPDFTARCASARCRSCLRAGLVPVLDLGSMPPSDRLLTRPMLDTEELRYPLEVAFCAHCCLVQILETVDPAQLFGEHYTYYSSFSDALLEHSRKNAEQLIKRYELNNQSLVIELASNDGYLLKNFRAADVPVLGIDPATGQTKAANEAGIPTLCAFFDIKLAQQLHHEGVEADVVIANNVLAHVADTNGFVQGIATLLKPNGVAAIEVPYVRELIEQCEFDTIYHEHLCYFSVTALDHLFRQNGLFLNDVERLTIHGGSLRLYVQKRERVQTAVRQMLQEESSMGMTGRRYYEGFAARVAALRQNLRQTVLELKRRGETVAAYGAAAKGTIMLNFTGLDADVIDFVVDRNVHKHGRFMPGVHIPILPVETLEERMPNYTVLLPWNFKDEILSQQSGYRRRGGKFIVPVPDVAVV